LGVQIEDEIEFTELDPAGLPPSTEPLRAPEWTVQVFKSERTVFELHRRYQQGLVELDPGFQRGDVWESLARSRLIESILALIPIPAIYMSEEDGENMLVVDGRQRLTTLFTFLAGDFELRGLQLLPQFNGMYFDMLDRRMRRRIEDTALTVFSIQAGSDPQVKFHLFERLNRGGVELRPQEIRNGIYRGPGLDKIQNLGREGGLFRRVAGKWRVYSHMKADELTLRCFALIHNPLEKYPGTMEVFLNDTLRAMNEMEASDLSQLTRRVRHALRCCEVVFGDHAFVRYLPETREWGNHLNLGNMDLQVLGFDRVHREPSFWKERRDSLRDELARLHLADDEFLASVLYSTSARAQLQYRTQLWLEVLIRVADSDA